jgi:signal transduction histidine kinase/HAMP domain-containing protein
MTLGAIRWKLFALITCSVAVPVAALSVYFPATRIMVLEAALTTKAASFSRVLVDQTRSAIAFDDSETAREIFDSITTDDDVAFVALLRADGSVLKSAGSRDDRAPLGNDQATVSHPRGRVRVVTPVLSREGPRGLLVLDLSMARAVSEGRHARHVALLIGLGALLFACIAAWLVGTSFGRRVGGVQTEAARVAAGDLSESRIVDSSRDEIGQLARAFQTMVQSLKRAYAGIEQQVLDRTEALATSREQFRALVETTDAVPWEMTVGSWQFTYVGPQAASLFGIPADDWADAHRWQSRVPPENLAEVIAALEKTVADGSEQAVEFSLQRADQRPMLIRILIGAASGDPVATLRGFMFDVTKRSELEAELRQAQKLESVGRLASGIAHEINTPVQFVSDSVHFVRTSFGEVVTLLASYRALGGGAGVEDSTVALSALAQVEEDIDLEYLIENVPKALERAIDGLDRVATIVRSMKAFGHPDQREKTTADLNGALANTLLIARHEYKEVADVETDFGNVPPVWCLIGELNQAFLNIIVNAAHAITDSAKGGDRGRIRIVTRQEGEDAVVEISDTGGGIPEAIRPRIFDPFFTTKEVGRGTGQGLAIARRSVIERHGGSLTFDTTMGQGTTFVIRIPSRQNVPA